MPWKFGTATDIGGRSEQQDRLAIFHSRNGRRHLAVVADGMGGLKNGAQAAQILVDVAAQRFAGHKNVAPFEFLDGICQNAHHAINAMHADDGSTPGTTAVLLYIDNQKVYWAHVGDSRLYRFRNGDFLHHTNDHSLLQLMLDKGLADMGGDARQMQNKLYMHLGGEVTPEPDFNEAEVENGDMFLLCSDGFWQAAQPGEMIAAIEQCPPDQDGPQYLVDFALQRSGHCCDNISLAVLQWQRATEKGRWQRLINQLRNRLQNVAMALSRTKKRASKATAAY